MEIVDKLRGADLRGLDLPEIDGGHIDFQYADMRRGDLRGLDVSDARMQNANLTGANLQLTPGTEASCVGTDTFVQAVAVRICDSIKVTQSYT